MSLPATVCSGTSSSICSRAHSSWLAFASGESRLILKKLRQGSHARQISCCRACAGLVRLGEHTSAARSAQSRRPHRLLGSCQHRSRWYTSQAERGSCAPCAACWWRRHGALSPRGLAQGRRRACSVARRLAKSSLVASLCARARMNSVPCALPGAARLPFSCFRVRGCRMQIPSTNL